MTNHTDSHSSKAESSNRPAEPPKILDHLLADIQAPTPAVPPKAGFPASPHASPPQSETDRNETEEPPRSITLPKQADGGKSPSSAALDDAVGGSDADTPPPTATASSRPAPRPASDGARGLRWLWVALGLLLLLNLSWALITYWTLQSAERVKQRGVRVVEVSDSTQPADPSSVRTPTPPPPPNEQASRDAANTASQASVPSAPEAPTPQLSLRIAKLVLCRSVTDFGVYQPIPSGPIYPRYVPHIQVYVEIEGPRPENRHDERYVYHMTKNVRLYRADIGPTEPLLDTTVSLLKGGRSPREDLFSSQSLQGTRRIEPGEHVLAVRITDQVSGLTAQQETRFTVDPP